MATKQLPPRQKDYIVDEVRRIRRKISKRFGHDVRKHCEYLMEMQKKYGDRLVKVRKRK